MQPKIGDIAVSALAFVASIGVGLLAFLASFIIAGIIIAFGQAGSRASEAIFSRIVGPERGVEFTKLSTATIRAVAEGVIGVAFIQAIIVGICLLIAGIPWAGVLAVIVLVLGIAQVPALLVTLPAIAYIWTIGDYGTVEASIYTVILVVAGMTDNVLKPLMLGRGVDAPMPVILIGALGGMAVSGILGMFVGATLLALGYQIFMGWVHTNPEAGNGRGRERNTGRRLSECAPPPWRTLPERLLLAGCLLLGACTTVGPDFVRPEVPWLNDWSSSALRSGAAEGQPHDRATTEQWWRNFNDPALDRLVAEAQRQNIDVHIAGREDRRPRTNERIPDAKAPGSRYLVAAGVSVVSLLTVSNVNELDRLIDFHRIERVRVVLDVGDGLLADLSERHRSGVTPRCPPCAAGRRQPGGRSGSPGRARPPVARERTAPAPYRSSGTASPKPVLVSTVKLK